MKRSFRILCITGLCLMLLLAMAITAQETLRRQGRDQLAQNAVFANVGTHELRISCSGTGNYTYVLEAGATGFAETWSWLQDALDGSARVCSYDRAGLGLSDIGPQGIRPQNVASDLHAALADIGEHGPFVLVGHSLGGLFVRDFAARFPDATAALILVDPSHERQFEQLPPEAAAKARAFPRMLRLLSAASTTGALRLWNPLLAGAAGLEGQAATAARAFAGDRGHIAASAAELEQWETIVRLAAGQQPDPRLPVLVVSAGSPVGGADEFLDAIRPLHRELAARSPAGRHVVIDEANHFSILMDREHAHALAAAIMDFTGRIDRSETTRPSLAESQSQ